MSKNGFTYTFEDFELDEEEGRLFQNQAKIALEPIPIKVLLSMVKKAGHVVTKEELRTAGWGYHVSEGSLTTCIRKIRKALDEGNSERFIETISGKGYKFIVAVKPVEKPSQVLVSTETATGELSVDADFPKFERPILFDSQASSDQAEESPQFFGARNTIIAIFGMVAAFILFNLGMNYRVCAGECFEQTVFIFLASIFYGILTGIGVLLECAYQFDKYGWRASKMIPSIVFVNAGSMFAGLTSAGNLLQKNDDFAFWTGMLFLVAGAIISCLLASFVLPNFPVTAARFSTQSAIAAFCKNAVIYFLPLYTIFGLLIFCFIYGSYEIAKSIASPIAFAVIWMIVFVFSYLSTNYLSDNLYTEKDGEKYKYHGLFSLLLELRRIFCFIPTLGGVVWYFIHGLVSK